MDIELILTEKIYFMLLSHDSDIVNKLTILSFPISNSNYIKNF